MAVGAVVMMVPGMEVFGVGVLEGMQPGLQRIGAAGVVGLLVR